MQTIVQACVSGTVGVLVADSSRNALVSCGGYTQTETRRRISRPLYAILGTLEALNTCALFTWILVMTLVRHSPLY